MQDRRVIELSEVPNLRGSHWRRIDVGPEWMEQFSSFARTAFRLEVLQAYAEPSEEKALADFKAGQPVGHEYITDWCELVKRHIDAGREMRRVHLVDLPLSSYLKFEIEAAYVHTSAAGEQINLLDRSKVSAELKPFLDQDFWLFDDRRVMVQVYNDAGTLQYSQVTQDPNSLNYYREVARRVLRLGEPLTTFYSRAEGKTLKLG